MMKSRALHLVVFAVATSFACSAAAKDGIRWTIEKKRGQPSLVGMPTGDEGDTEFWALCKRGGKIEIGVGANSIVGKGEGDTVSLSLKSGAVSAALEGKSQNSENVEMTGGSELRAEIDAGHPLFTVLATGRPITVSGSMDQPATWPVAGLKAKVAAFLAACKK
jgi:hypothetical protein